VNVPGTQSNGYYYEALEDFFRRHPELNERIAAICKEDQGRYRQEALALARDQDVRNPKRVRDQVLEVQKPKRTRAQEIARREAELAVMRRELEFENVIQACKNATRLLESMSINRFVEFRKNEDVMRLIDLLGRLPRMYAEIKFAS
jgi:hypothetical protein